MAAGHGLRGVRSPGPNAGTATAKASPGDQAGAGRLVPGWLRARFEADVRRHGGKASSAAAVASGYVALGWAAVLAAGCLWELAAAPGHIFICLLMFAGSIASLAAFVHMRRGGHPGAALAAIALSGLALLPVAVGPDLAGSPVLTFASLGIAVMAMLAFALIGELSRRHAARLLAVADDELRRRDAERRAAMDAARIALWEISDLANRTFVASESLAALTGYDAAEFGQYLDRLEDIVHPDDLVRVREDLAGAIRRLGRTRSEFRLKTRLRGYRWFVVKARFVRTAEGGVKVTGSFQDVSFLKSTEDSLRASRDSAQRADKAKTDFLAIMSHEIRTPLNAVLVSVELLRRRDNTPENAALIRTIEDAGQGLLSLANDMLDIARIEAGRLDLRPADCDVSGLVRRTADLWRPQAAQRGLDLDVDTHGLSIPELAADEARIRQVLGNLLSNAIKFTAAGKVSIIASGKVEPSGRWRVRIDVRDTGPGIPADAASRLFSPFEQVDPASGQAGAGLGLSICRKLAQLMDGDVVLSESGPTGSCFTFIFQAEPAEPPVEAAETALAATRLRLGGRVLCVDDNEANRRLLGMLLSEFGVEPQLAASGEEALRLCELRLYDLVLMDILMPGMDGLETLRRLRMPGASANHRTPVVALTARVAQDDRDAYRRAGFDGVAQKPIDVRELAAVLERHLGSSAQATPRGGRIASN